MISVYIKLFIQTNLKEDFHKSYSHMSEVEKERK
jgi:hypothetical protein